MTTEQTQGQSETRPSEVRSDALLAAAFADYWHGKWPNQTQEVKRLELSAHYRGCRDAFYAGAKAANVAEWVAKRLVKATTKKGNM